MDDLWCFRKEVLIQMVKDAEVSKCRCFSNSGRKGFPLDNYDRVGMKSAMTDQLFYSVCVDSGNSVCILATFTKKDRVDKEICIYRDNRFVEMDTILINELLKTLPGLIENLSKEVERLKIKKRGDHNNNRYEDKDMDYIRKKLQNLDSVYEMDIQSLSTIVPGKPLF